MDIEDIAYDKGQNAQHDGYTLKDNPFKRFSPEWEQWKMGWGDMNNDDPYWKNVKRLQRNAFNRIKNEKTN